MVAEPNAASVALLRNGRVLLIQRARPPYTGLWTLPGGRREPGETAEQCAAREVHEELGLSVGRLRLVATHPFGDAAGRDWTLAVFATDDFSGAIVPSDEIAGYRWLAPAEIGAIETTANLASLLDRALRVLAAK